MNIPHTYAIKYAGSKLKLLPNILEMIAPLGVQTVLDAFSGSTRVSQALAQSGYAVHANDRAHWSEVLATAFLLNEKPAHHYQPIIDHLNSLAPVDGWFARHYGGEEADQKRPFQAKNMRKLDAIRPEIDHMGLDPVEWAVALSALMLALDAVDSTLGHFAAYLGKWSARSYKDLVLEVPPLWVNATQHRVSRKDVFEVKAAPVDLAYLDPPYGSNNEKMPPSRVRYSAYYHFWTTVVLNDQPEIFGAAARRVDSKDTVAGSLFEEFRQNDSGRFIAMEAIEKLVSGVQAAYVLLSYSSGGRATKAELHDILQANGSLLQAVEVDYKQNVMSSMTRTDEWVRKTDRHREYLFLLKKE